MSNIPKKSNSTNSGANRDLDRLAPLVGKWATRGWTRETLSSPAVEIIATDTYEWIADGFVLLHTVDAQVGKETVKGAEILSFDREQKMFVTQYFGSDGPNTYTAEMVDEDGVLVWKMESKVDRFTGRFSEDGNTIKGYWELLDENKNWKPWMDITLTKHS